MDTSCKDAHMLTANLGEHPKSPFRTPRSTVSSLREPRQLEMSKARSYLVLYNAVQAIGWATALFLVTTASCGRPSFRETYQQSNAVVSRRARASVKAQRLPDQLSLACAHAGLFQLASALEIVHAATGRYCSAPCISTFAL